MLWSLSNANCIAGNATYIMSLEQGMYFLNNLIRNNDCDKNFNDNKAGVESSVTKSTLRETEHVKVKNASKGWGVNVVEAMKKLSPTLKQKLKNDKQYNRKIDEIVDAIREDYEMRRD